MNERTNECTVNTDVDMYIWVCVRVCVCESDDD